MRFSLVMPTLGRVEEPARFLASLREQRFRDFELIVVDQNPDERLRPLLAACRDEFPVLHLRLRESGASRARNAGLERCRGEIVTFPDDDCRYPAGLLEHVSGFFAGNPGIDVLCGRLVDDEGRSSILDFDLEAGLVDASNVWVRSIESTIFVRRGATRRVWFDENLGKGAGTPWGSGEGTDYLLKLLELGSLIYYDPDVNVIHPSPVPPYDRRACRRAYSYGCGMGRVLRKYKYPVRSRISYLSGPAAEAVRSLAGLRPDRAGYYWNVFRGRLRGML
jgi:glycosyltransferase involved in cell wall biosynthesis